MFRVLRDLKARVALPARIAATPVFMVILRLIEPAQVVT